MRLRKIKDAYSKVCKSKYFISNPEDYKGKYNELFNNSNKINLEIGMGKGDFIINMALKYPDINFIGLAKYDSVMLRAVEKLENTNIPNLKLILYDANNIDNINLFAYSLSSLSKDGYILDRVSLDLHLEDIDNIETEYEHKFSSNGIKINYLNAHKNI